MSNALNLYPAILGAVLLAGLGITIWGWKILANSRKIKQWPTVEGMIEKSYEKPENDLLPHIIFSYQVEAKQHQRKFKFPEGTHPLPEFNKAYLNKYPVGKNVTVYYNPNQPETSTLEPETQGDWMILALGIMMAAGGLITLLVT